MDTEPPLSLPQGPSGPGQLLQNERQVVRQAGRQAIRQFLEQHNCYSVLRASGKVVVFDVRIPIQLAFYALVEHGTFFLSFSLSLLVLSFSLSLVLSLSGSLFLVLSGRISQEGSLGQGSLRKDLSGRISLSGSRISQEGSLSLRQGSLSLSAHSPLPHYIPLTI
jgi:hypothetical protein